MSETVTQVSETEQKIVRSRTCGCKVIRDRLCQCKQSGGIRCCVDDKQDW